MLNMSVFLRSVYIYTFHIWDHNVTRCPMWLFRMVQRIVFLFYPTGVGILGAEQSNLLLKSAFTRLNNKNQCSTNKIVHCCGHLAFKFVFGSSSSFFHEILSSDVNMAEKQGEEISNSENCTV